MREEWADAGPGRRVIFAGAALYWLAMLALAMSATLGADSARDAGRALGSYSAPLLIAAIVRGGYVLLSSSRPRPRFWSWWLLVIGAALGIFLALQRAAAELAERAT